MRTSSILALGMLAGAAVFGASTPQNTTYIEGNLTGITPHSGGTLLFSDQNAMQLKTLAQTTPVPYQSISKAELGAVKVHTPDVPLYKAYKRFTSKTRTQYLTVHFRSETGEDKSMTLELPQSAANEVLSTIENHTRAGVVASSKRSKPSASSSEWWGDDYWKTTRNSDKWNTKTDTATAP